MQVQPGGGALAAGLRQQLGEGGDRRVAAGAVDRPHAPQVAGEVAAVDEAGERELLEQAEPMSSKRFSRSSAAARPGGAATQPSRSAGLTVF